MRNRVHAVVKNLLAGEVVCFPTETVYAFAVDSCNASAIEKLYCLKSRDLKKPYAVIVDSLDMARCIGYISDDYIDLISANPNSTFVVWKKKHCSYDLASGCFSSDGKVAFRIPNHSFPIAIISVLRRPIVATSANVSTKSSNVARYQDISFELLSKVSCSFVADRHVAGTPSRIIDITCEEGPKFFR